MYFKKYAMLSFVFIALLILVRCVVSNTFNYVFLFWNLLLALIPVAISNWALQNDNWQKWKIIKLLIFGTWLIFLPNAPYVITDFFHLSKRPPIPLYFDTILLFMCAFTGIVFYIIAVKQMEILWRRYYKFNIIWFYFSAFCLTSFGIYLGRYLRFNSWELLTNPLSLFYEILHRLVYPLQHPKTWGVTMLFSILLLLVYKLTENLLQIINTHLQSVTETEERAERQ